MPTIRQLVERMERDFVPRLGVVSQSFVRGDLHDGEDDVAMALDDMLQFALVDDVPMPADMLDEAEEIVRRGGQDPDLEERTLGWIAQHRQRQAASA